MSKNVSICVISTGKYDVFLAPLLKSIDEKFLVNHNVTVNIFTDKAENLVWEYSKNPVSTRIKLVFHEIETLKWPEATLLRYKTFLKKEEYLTQYDYIYYLDVDMLVVKEVGEEIFGELVAVGHPGYSVVGGGAWCDDMNSLAYTLPTKRQMYVAGGFQGGNHKYIAAMKKMAENINIDSSRNVMAPWHDESHWNKFFSENREKFKLLHSGYCMVENESQQKQWKIDKLPKYIIALDKDHASIRS